MYIAIFFIIFDCFLHNIMNFAKFVLIIRIVNIEFICKIMYNNIIDLAL